MSSTEQYPLKNVSLQKRLEDVLAFAMTADGAIGGTLQLYNAKASRLEIAAQHGFSASFLDFFRYVRADEPCACGRALRNGTRVVIRDISADPYFSPYLSIAREAGYRAVQSTPFFGRDNRRLGVFSTHFAEVTELSPIANALLDECAARLAQIVEEMSAAPFADR